MKVPSALALSLALVSCSPTEKPEPETQTSQSYKPTGKMPEPKDDRTSLDAPVPDKAMAKKYGVSLEHIGQGHAVYLRKCGECHLHVLPDQVDSKNWHGIVPGMSWNAGISPEEEKALIDYLNAASQEPK